MVASFPHMRDAQTLTVFVVSNDEQERKAIADGIEQRMKAQNQYLEIRSFARYADVKTEYSGRALKESEAGVSWQDAARFKDQGGVKAETIRPILLVMGDCSKEADPDVRNKFAEVVRSDNESQKGIVSLRTEMIRVAPKGLPDPDGMVDISDNRLYALNFTYDPAKPGSWAGIQKNVVESSVKYLANVIKGLGGKSR